MNAKPKKPQIYPRVELETEQIAQLMAAARRQDMSVSEFIALLIRKSLTPNPQ